MTKQQKISQIYSSQSQRSKRRAHNPTTYTKDELQEWLQNDWLFGLLFNNWSNCGRPTHLSPSLDRIDDSKGYSFDNIQVMAWWENRSKANKDTRSGKLKCSNPLKPVQQFTKDGKLIKNFPSLGEASRETKINHASISICCNNGRLKSAGGFIWRFSKI